MKITTTYKHIKHGYVRTTPQGDLQLSLPRWKRFDASFKQILITKGKNLLKKQKQKKVMHIKRMTPTHVRIWGEMVAKKELPQDIDTHLRTLCRDQAIIRADKYSALLKYKYNILRIKKITSKRGSCSSKQNLNINLDLVHLDKKILEYVVVHEVCHLQHKHHQKAFRDAVETLSPEYKKIKKVLRQTHFS